MAMTRTLFSISALAVELGRDRRTIASALDSVPSDGTIAGGHRGWFLTSVLDAIERGGGVAGGDGPLRHFADRLDAWQEIHQGENIDMPLDDAAVAFDIESERLVTWLRAGLPYVAAGDFETGEGFILRASWLVDWQINLQCLARASGDRTRARKLMLN